MDRTYAQALIEGSQGKDARELSVFAKTFVAYLKSKGHEKLLPKIFRRYEELLAREQKKNTISITLGHEKVLHGHKQDLQEELKKIFGKEVDIETRVDESLIGGYLVEGKGIRIDRSFKSSLKNLYQKMITTHE